MSSIFVEDHLHGTKVICTLPVSSAPSDTVATTSVGTATTTTTVDAATTTTVATVAAQVAGAAIASPAKPKLHVATHSGMFHCDEALACGLLRCTEQFSNCVFVRTRNAELIDQCNSAVDVGGVYNPTEFRFDHHQKEFTGTMTTNFKTYNTRLSSAGLVYKHYGKEIIARYALFLMEAGRVSVDTLFPGQQHQQSCAEGQGTVTMTLPSIAEIVVSSTTAIVFDRLYKTWVEHIDGNDNGVEPNSGGTKNYQVGSTLPGRIAKLFPRWNEQTYQELENDRFILAMHLATTEFFDQLEDLLCSWWPGCAIVMNAVRNCATTHASKRIIFFPGIVPPWRDHIYDAERDLNIVGQILYVVSKSRNGGFSVTCVSEENAGFTNRKSLLWKGLTGNQLSETSGIPGGVFVHVTGFTGGNDTFDGAMAMAVKSLEAPDTVHQEE
jgi:MYG1 exonuclease